MAFDVSSRQYTTAVSWLIRYLAKKGDSIRSSSEAHIGGSALGTPEEISDRFVTVSLADPSSAWHCRESAEITMHFANQRISSDVLDEICAVASNELEFGEKIAALFNGEIVNISEGRPALHMALRGEASSDIGRVYSHHYMPKTAQDRVDWMAFAGSILYGQITDGRGENFTDAVCIGIGGSHLGPEMVCKALPKCDSGLNVHFIANVDPAAAEAVLRKLNAATTLVIATSKTFATAEMLRNLEIVRSWQRASGLDKDRCARNSVAITAAKSRAENLGFISEQIFVFDEAVGGRFSLWGPVGMPICLHAGNDAFTQLLSGARSMDNHFRSAPLRRNMPFLMAALRVWNNIGLKIPTHVVLPYAQALGMLPDYLQQLMMESLGKRFSYNGEVVRHPTGQTVFGSVGTNAQHSFMQMLQQGGVDPAVAVDLIGFLHPLCKSGVVENKAAHDAHRELLANMAAQARALARGFRSSEHPDWECSGNRPNTVFVCTQELLHDDLHLNTPGMSPRCLGALLAAYEHSVFCEAVLLGINPFDQPGVQAGKVMATRVLEAMSSPSNPIDGSEEFDPTTLAIINAVRATLSSSF